MGGGNKLAVPFGLQSLFLANSRGTDSTCLTWNGSDGHRGAVDALGGLLVARSLVGELIPSIVQLNVRAGKVIDPRPMRRYSDLTNDLQRIVPCEIAARRCGPGNELAPVIRNDRECAPRRAGHTDDPVDRSNLYAVTRSDAGKFQRRGLRREDAAAYIGISPTKFDDWVRRQLMPSPKRQDGVVVWDRFALDAAFEALGTENAAEDLSIWNDLKV
ncbi:MAG TPA: hypothetical protein VMS78_06605 [Rhizomicrobium sp.]|nr:hypothetical protein [Rhizomicrobium sp.]